jgi:biopolymer transport protein ExbB
MNANWENIWNIWVSGGWVMIPLLALAGTLYYMAIQLLVYTYREGPQGRNADKWEDWVENPAGAHGASGEIIAYTQAGVESSAQIRGRFEEVEETLVGQVDQRLTVVQTLVGAAPLMGLLGTVIGMLLTFEGIAKGAGSETASQVAEGISQALITTQTGLMIALPGIFMVLVIRRRLKLWESHLARLEGLTLTKFNFSS